MYTSFTPIRQLLDGNFDGKQVKVRGWVYRKRTGKDVEAERLAEVQPPFPRIAYDQLIGKLNKIGL